MKFGYKGKSKHLDLTLCERGTWLDLSTTFPGPNFLELGQAPILKESQAHYGSNIQLDHNSGDCCSQPKDEAIWP